jgi:hypothetical protein
LPRRMKDRRPSAAVVIVRKMAHVWRLGGTLVRSRLLHAMDEPRSFVECYGNLRFTGVVH